jgi:hypothetical protein
MRAVDDRDQAHLPPSRRGMTWNDTASIDRHRNMTPAQRVSKALQISRAALRFARAPRSPHERGR